MKNKAKIIGFVLTVLFVACKTNSPNAKVNIGEYTNESTSNQLTGTWELVDFKTPTVANQTVKEMFPEKLPFFYIDVVEMKFYGEDGCNLQRGKVKEIGRSTLSIEPGSTPFKTHCDGVQSSAYKIAFGKINEYKIQGEKLTLTSEDHQIILTYKRINNHQ